MPTSLKIARWTSSSSQRISRKLCAWRTRSPSRVSSTPLRPTNTAAASSSAAPASERSSMSCPNPSSRRARSCVGIASAFRNGSPSEVIAAQAQRTRLRQLEILVLMGALQAFAPLSIDMYLPSLPLLERVFGATTAQVQFTLATFFVGYALGQSLYGPITDRYGRKPPLYFSLLLFVLSSIACATSRSIGALAFFRLLQAIGACGGAVISRAMVRDLFPPDQMRRVFSMLMLVMGVSPVAAPVIGGYVLIWFGWKAIFFTQASLGLACLIGVHLRLPESLSPDDVRPLHASHILSSYKRLFRDRTFLGASLVSGFSSAGMFAYIASAPFVFINIYRVPTQRFGWLFGAIAAGVITASQVNGRMLHGVPLWRVLRTANLGQLG